MIKILRSETRRLIFCYDQYFNQFNILIVNIIYFIWSFYIHFAVIHRSSLNTVEWILSKPITSFNNDDNVNINVEKLKQTKTRMKQRGKWRGKWALKKHLSRADDTPSPFFGKSKKGKRRKKERVSKQKLLKGVTNVKMLPF